MSRDLSLVAVSLVLWGTGEGMFYYFQPIYLQTLGANPEQIGLILGGMGMAMAVAHIPAGYLADRIGRRPLMWTAWINGVIATWIMALARGLPVFVAGIVLYGLTAYVSGPMNSYVTAARGKWSVGRAFTLVSAIYATGSILGPLIGGWIGDRMGLRPAFFIAGVLFIFSTGVILLIRPQPVEAHPDGQPRPGMRSVLTPVYARYLSVIFFVTFCLYLPQPLSQNFLVNQRGISLGTVGQLIAARSLGVVVLNLLAGQMNARSGYLAAQAGVGLFTLLLWQGSGLPAYFLGYFLLGSYQTARAFGSAQARSLVGSINMGLGYGMIETVTNLAIILAPPLAGVLYTRAPASIYSVSLALIAAAMLFTRLFSPIRQEDIL